MAGNQGSGRRRGYGRRSRSRAGLLLPSLVGLLAVVLLLPATAAAATVTEYEIPTATSQPTGITVGPDGALWFTEENGHKIARITTDGQITEFPISNPSAPGEITAGPPGDRSVWFTEFGANPPKVGRIPVDGGPPQEFALPDGFYGPDGITAGPDGAIWFTLNSAGRIGRITLDGSLIQSFGAENGMTGWRPGDITPGPDGRLWFTESEAGKVGAIRPGDPPVIEEYDLPGSDPSGIAASGGSIWFTMHSLDLVGRISTLGQSPDRFGPTGRGPSGIALGPDGALWFAETEANKIGRMTTTGRVTEFQLPPDPRGPNWPEEIVAGPDGAMWFTEKGVNKIGRIEAGSPTSTFVPPPQPPPLQLTSKPLPPLPAKTNAACRVPRLRGLTVAQARRKLRRAKCRYRIRGKGRVTSSRPRAGTRTRARVELRARPVELRSKRARRQR